MKSTSLQITSIRLDGGTQPREEMDAEHVERLAESLKDGAVIPPVTVFLDETLETPTYWLADGYHRLYAHLANGWKHIMCDVRVGNRREAVVHSVGCNAEHGLQRSNRDKRRAVVTLLQDPDWSKWSDRKIAGVAKVSQPFVSGVRKEVLTDNVISENPENERKFTTKHGTEATMQTGKIGKSFRVDGAESTPPTPHVRVNADTTPLSPALVSHIDRHLNQTKATEGAEPTPRLTPMIANNAACNHDDLEQISEPIEMDEPPRAANDEHELALICAECGAAASCQLNNDYGYLCDQCCDHENPEVCSLLYEYPEGGSEAETESEPKADSASEYVFDPNAGQFDDLKAVVERNRLRRENNKIRFAPFLGPVSLIEQAMLVLGDLNDLKSQADESETRETELNYQCLAILIDFFEFHWPTSEFSAGDRNLSA